MVVGALVAWDVDDKELDGAQGIITAVDVDTETCTVEYYSDAYGKVTQAEAFAWELVLVVAGRA